MPVVKSIQSQRAGNARAARRRVYADPRWRGLAGCRLQVLQRDAWRCVLCGQRATIADHHPLTLQQLLDHGLNPYQPDTCRSLCHHCSGHADGGRT